MPEKGKDEVKREVRIRQYPPIMRLNTTKTTLSINQYFFTQKREEKKEKESLLFGALDAAVKVFSKNTIQLQADGDFLKNPQGLTLTDARREGCAAPLTLLCFYFLG